MRALTGPSGSGKSTLLNCLGLLDVPTAGAIRHGEKDITRFGPRQARGFGRDVLGYLFQNYALLDNARIPPTLAADTNPRRGLRRPTSTAIPQALERVGLAGRGGEKV